jgi:hypothetical protein
MSVPKHCVRGPISMHIPKAGVLQLLRLQSVNKSLWYSIGRTILSEDVLLATHLSELMVLYIDIVFLIFVTFGENECMYIWTTTQVRIKILKKSIDQLKKSWHQI